MGTPGPVRPPDGRSLGPVAAGRSAAPSRPARCRRPLPACWAEALRPLQAPGPPRRRPAACSDRGNPGILWPCDRGGRAFAVCAQSDEEAGSTDGPSPWEGWEAGAGGRALGTRRDGRVAGRDGRPGEAPRGHQRVAQQGMWSDAGRSGGPRRGALDGLEAGCEAGCRAPGVGAAAGLKGDATRAWGGLPGRPATPKGTAKGGVLVLHPWPPMRARVCAGPGEAGGQAHLLPAHAPPMGAALLEGAPGGPVRMERRQRIPRRAQPCARQWGLGGSVLRPAGGCRLRATVPTAADCSGRGPASPPGVGQSPKALGCVPGRAPRGGCASASAVEGPTRREPRASAHAASTHVGRGQQPGAT
jgi:hypothetical protein